MASRADIQAGRAYVSLHTKDQGLIGGLKRASAKLKQFAVAAALTGAALASAAVAGAAVAVRQFLSVGDALAKMAQRTGLSVESLSELQHAAEQSGTSLEAVEKAVRFMQKSGMKGDQFDAIAASIAKIEDPSKRAQMAMKVWGKAGTELLPMIADLAALRKEARDLGLVMSGDAANRAVALGDAFSNLWKTVKFGAVAIGSAIAPTLQSTVGIVQSAFTSVLKFIQNNGAAITAAVQGTITFIGDAWSGLLTFVTPIVGALSATVETAWNAISAVTSSVWTGISEIITGVFGNITTNAGGVFQWLQDTILGALGAISFAFTNWQLLAQTAVTSALVGIVSFAADVGHFFTAVIPAYLVWFNTHWHETFTDVFNFTKTVFMNMLKNVAAVWEAIKGVFKGKGFSVDWTPLTEGFKSVMTELPEIAEREKGPLEKSLRADLDKLVGQVGDAWDKHDAEWSKKVKEFKAAEIKVEQARQVVATKNREQQEELAAAVPDQASLKKTEREVFVSFSAAAIQARGAGGGGSSSPVVKRLEKSAKEAQKQNDRLVQAIQSGGVFVA